MTTSIPVNASPFQVINASTRVCVGAFPTQNAAVAHAFRCRDWSKGATHFLVYKTEFVTGTSVYAERTARQRGAK